jgi:hypothetical protein
MVEDNLHGFLHDDVVLSSEPLHRWVGWWSLPFKVFGQNQNILLGEQALLFEQFPNGFQLVHIVDGHLPKRTRPHAQAHLARVSLFRCIQRSHHHQWE